MISLIVMGLALLVNRMAVADPLNGTIRAASAIMWVTFTGVWLCEAASVLVKYGTACH